MPYIPKKDRPFLDEKVEELAEELASQFEEKKKTVEISVVYRTVFNDIADTIYNLEKSTDNSIISKIKIKNLISKLLEKIGLRRKNVIKTKAQELAYSTIEVAKKYGHEGMWLGSLNYSITTLIQAVPLKMVKKEKLKEAFRYWLYVETVGALTRTALDMHQKTGNDWISNGLAGVFEDVKDEYKRRVNIPYEATQILSSGDCYDMSPYHTQVVPIEVDGVKGFIEIMLPKQELPEPKEKK